jgi:hypothetical protein
MNNRKNSIVLSIDVLILLLAATVRLVNLGSPALSDYEASWALQALHLSQGTHVLLGAQVAYYQLTALLFDIFKPSNFTARLVPALFGSLVVLLPILLRKKIGLVPSIALGFFLAIDPGMVAVSRQAGSPAIALAAGGLALACWIAGKTGWAGFFLGTALLGGESFWAGLLAFSLAAGLMRLLDKEALSNLKLFLLNDPEGTGAKGQPAVEDESGKSSQNPLRQFLILTGSTVLGLGTFFFIRPAGLSGLASGLTTYLSGWGTFSGITARELLISLVVYQPIAVILGTWGGIHGWVKKNPLDRFLSLWAAFALVLALAYPGREVDHLVWTLLPLWMLAGRELANQIRIYKEEQVNILIQTGLTFALLVFCWLNLQGIVANLTYGTIGTTRLIAIGVALCLLLITSVLVSWGWNPGIAGKGLVWGIILFLLIYGITSAFGAGAMRSEATAETWRRGTTLPEADLVVKMINELSDTTRGNRNDLDITIIGIDSPGLEWILRDFPDPVFANALAEGSMPSIVITLEDNEPVLAASYRGNGFVLSQEPNWSETFTYDFLPWLVYHSAPQTSQPAILWARVDLFPEVSIDLTSNPTP